MVLLLVSFALFLILGMPISFCMMGASMLYMLVNELPLFTVVQTMTSSIGESFTIIAIPFFILAGNIMNNSGITQKIFDFANVCVGWFPGGLGHVNILASIIFSGMSGTAVADAGGLGAIELDAMKKAGYDDDFSLAVTGASSIIGPIIPPSVPAVTFAVAGGVSVGALFVAGVIPGVIMGLAMAVLVYVTSKKRNYAVCARPTLKMAVKAFGNSFFELLTPVILIGGISTGIFTPTEAAAVCVLYALVLSFATRSITVKEIPGFVKETLKNTVGITFIIAAASIFSYILTIEQVPAMLTNLFLDNVHNRYLALLLINLILLVVGMFMETMASLTVLTPILLPVAVSFGVHPVHFGIIMILNLMIGLLTPPVGTVLYVLAGLSDVSFEKIAKAILPYVGVLMVVLLILTFVPELVLFLPRLMGMAV